MATPESETKSMLSVGNYHIEFDISGGTHIYMLDANGGNKEWIAATTDPEMGTKIVEGLILVEQKRFYYPESDPVFTSGNDKPLPPFLKKKRPDAQK